MSTFAGDESSQLCIAWHWALASAGRHEMLRTLHQFQSISGVRSPLKSKPWNKQHRDLGSSRSCLMPHQSMVGRTEYCRVCRFLFVNRADQDSCYCSYLASQEDLYILRLLDVAEEDHHVRDAGIQRTTLDKHLGRDAEKHLICLELCFLQLIQDVLYTVLVSRIA